MRFPLRSLVPEPLYYLSLFLYYLTCLESIPSPKLLNKLGKCPKVIESITNNFERTIAHARNYSTVYGSLSIFIYNTYTTVIAHCICTTCDDRANVLSTLK